jgi:hypothetical protein
MSKSLPAAGRQMSNQCQITVTQGFSLDPINPEGLSYTLDFI